MAIIQPADGERGSYTRRRYHAETRDASSGDSTNSQACATVGAGADS